MPATTVMNSYYTLVASKQDPASNVMAEYLINQVGFSKNRNAIGLKS